MGIRVKVIQAFEELLDQVEQKARAKRLQPHEMHMHFLGTIDEHRHDFLQAAFDYFLEVYYDAHPAEKQP